MKQQLFAHFLLQKQWLFPRDEASVRAPGTRAEVKISATQSHSA